MRKMLLSLMLSTLSLGAWAEPQGTSPQAEEASRTTTASAQANEVMDRSSEKEPEVQKTSAPAEKTETQAPRPEKPRKPKPPLEIKWIEF